MEEQVNNIERLLEQMAKMQMNPIHIIPSKEELEMRGKLAKKMAAIIKNTGKVEKKGTNTQQHYKFASHADIIDEIRKVIAENDIYILPKPDSYEVSPIASSSGSKGLNVVMKMDFEIIDAETGYSMQMHWFGQGIDYGDKAFYKSYTGALKYFLLDTFMISTGDDPENDSPEQKAAARPVAPRLIPAITTAQLDRIEELLKQKGKTNEDLAKAVQTGFKKTKVEQLTSAEASRLITKLDSLDDYIASDPDFDPDEIDKGITEMEEKKEAKK